MDVVDSNFFAAISILEDHLPSAEFVSFDLEFTGLGEHRPSQIDTPEIRYDSARKDANAFPPIQFGLCLFRPSKQLKSQKDDDVPESQKQWETICFNFNIVPRAVYYPLNARYPMFDNLFTVQSSTIDFLTGHGFDFQKCFREGIPWLQKEQEKQLFDVVLNEMKRRRTSSQSLATSNAEEAMLAKMWIEKIDKWVASLENEEKAPEAKCQFPKITSFLLPHIPWKRRGVFDLIRLKYPTISAHIIPAQSGKKMIKLCLYANEEVAKAEHSKTIEKDAEELVARHVKFRYVVDLIRKHKKPIIVHNGLMDVTKLYANFIGKLPSELAEFKRAFLENFPEMYDTRHMVDSLSVRDEEVRRELRKVRGVAETLESLKKLAKKRNISVAINTFIPLPGNDQFPPEVVNQSTEGFKGDQFPPEVVNQFTEGFKGILTNRVSDELVARDSHGFGRYLTQGVEHEAGYDALETGFLFCYLDILGEKSVNKLALGACGGFGCINFNNTNEESNPWFHLPTIIVKGTLNNEEALKRNTHPGKESLRQILKLITKDTMYCGEQSEIVPAGKDVFISILKVKLQRKRKNDQRDADSDEKVTVQAPLDGDPLQSVFENAKEQNFKVTRYSKDELRGDWGTISRMRMFL